MDNIHKKLQVLLSQAEELNKAQEDSFNDIESQVDGLESDKDKDMMKSFLERVSSAKKEGSIDSLNSIVLELKDIIK